jgi:hypothetical protein
MFSNDEINARALDYANRYRDPELMATLKLVLDGKIIDLSGNVIRYGEITHLNKDRIPTVIFAFTDGVIKHASPIAWVGDSKQNFVKGSVRFDLNA